LKKLLKKIRRPKMRVGVEMPFAEGTAYSTNIYEEMTIDDLEKEY